MWFWRTFFKSPDSPAPPEQASQAGAAEANGDVKTNSKTLGAPKDQGLEHVKLNLEGEVTKLDMNESFGVISHIYRFSTDNIPSGLKKGARVAFHAKNDRESALWTATDVTPKENRADSKIEQKSSFFNTFSGSYQVLHILPDKIIVGPEVEPKDGLEPFDLDVEIGKEHLLKDHPVIIGDWLHINFAGDSEDLSTAKILSVDFKEKITKLGTITKNKGYYCVADAIYFTNDLIEDGRVPSLGDKVRVTAVASAQIPAKRVKTSDPKHIFKMRALSVTILSCAPSYNDNSTVGLNEAAGIIRENVFKELLQDKNKVRIFPKSTISFKSKVVGSTSSEEVTVENIGERSVLLTRISTGKTQDVARFDFEFRNGNSQNSQELLLDLLPHRSWCFTIKCTPLQMGRTKELIIFDFGTFKIGRWLYVHSVDPRQDDIVQYRPEILSNLGRQRRQASVDNLIIEKNMRVVSAPKLVRPSFFLPNKIGASEVPEHVLYCYQNKSNDALLALYPTLAEELAPNNYVDHFKVTLWFEEIQNEIARREYDLQGVVLKHVGDYYSVDVPGLKEFHPPVWTGDTVRIYESLNSTEMYEGPITNISFDNEDLPSIRIQLPEKFQRVYHGSPCIVQFTLGRTPFKRMHFAVEQAVKHLGACWLFPTELILQEPRIDFFEDEEDNLHPLVQPTNTQSMMPRRISQTKEPHGEGRSRSLNHFQGNVAEPSYLDTVKLKWYNHRLNEEQKDAVRRILKGQGRPLPYIIFGPPGTGKTITVVEAIMQVYFLEPSARILVTVPSNAATDLIAERLVATNRFKPGDFVRLNGFHRLGVAIPKSIVEFCEDGKHLEDVAQKRLIVCTIATAGQFFYLSLNTGHFSHVFIDEAGYCTEPETMIPCVLAAIEKQSQVILVGDPEQLGPVLMCDVEMNKLLERSFLQRLMSTKVYARDEGTFPETKYNPAVITKLVKSYRAHPTLLKLPSRLFYSDELVSCATQEDAFDLLNLPFLPKQGVPLIFHGVDGNCNHDIDSSPSWYNSAEAFQVLKYIKLLRQNGVPSEDIGVITPYRKQVEKIRTALKMLLPDGVALPRIASVQEFQGAERKAMIISTVRSYSQDIIKRKVSRLDFLYSKKRFNVAITRAKGLMIVIGNPVVLSYNTYWRQLLEYAAELGVLTGCQLPPCVDPRWEQIKRTLVVSQKQDLSENGVDPKSELEDEEQYDYNEEDGASRF